MTEEEKPESTTAPEAPPEEEYKVSAFGCLTSLIVLFLLTSVALALFSAFVIESKDEMENLADPQLTVVFKKELDLRKRYSDEGLRLKNAGKIPLGFTATIKNQFYRALGMRSKLPDYLQKIEQCNDRMRDAVWKKYQKEHPVIGYVFNIPYFKGYVQRITDIIGFFIACVLGFIFFVSMVSVKAAGSTRTVVWQETSALTGQTYERKETIRE